MKKNNTDLTILENALQGSCKATKTQLEYLVKSSFNKTIKNQANYILNAFEFGLVAMQSKQAIPHGKYYDWLEEILGGKNNFRTALRHIAMSRSMMFLFGNLDNNNNISERIKIFLTVNQIEENDLLPKLKDKEFRAKLILDIGANLSFSRFTEILRCANADGQAIENKIHKKRIEDKSPKNPEETSTPVRINFFNELFTDIKDALEIKRQKVEFLNMSKDELSEIGNYLVNQGREILTLAKSSKE